ADADQGSIDAAEGRNRHRRAGGASSAARIDPAGGGSCRTGWRGRPARARSCAGRAGWRKSHPGPGRKSRINSQAVHASVAVTAHSTMIRTSANQRPRMLFSTLRTLVKIAVASLIVGTILSHFGITAEALLREA